MGRDSSFTWKNIDIGEQKQCLVLYRINLFRVRNVYFVSRNKKGRRYIIHFLSNNTKKALLKLDEEAKTKEQKKFLKQLEIL